MIIKAVKVLRSTAVLVLVFGFIAGPLIVGSDLEGDAGLYDGLVVFYVSMLVAVLVMGLAFGLARIAGGKLDVDGTFRKDDGVGRKQ